MKGKFVKTSKVSKYYESSCIILNAILEVPLLRPWMLCDRGGGLILSMISIFSLFDLLLMSELMLEFESTF